MTSAVQLAASLGASQAAVGLTIVAVGTSLPEFATTVIASLRGHGIAIGNVAGSNIFNVLGILGLTASLQPLQLGELTWIDLGPMLAFACLVTVLIATRLRLGRAEGGLLLMIFGLYLSWRLAA